MAAAYDPYSILPDIGDDIDSSDAELTAEALVTAFADPYLAGVPAVTECNDSKLGRNSSSTSALPGRGRGRGRLRGRSVVTGAPARSLGATTHPTAPAVSSHACTDARDNIGAVAPPDVAPAGRWGNAVISSYLATPTGVSGIGPQQLPRSSQSRRDSAGENPAGTCAVIDPYMDVSTVPEVAVQSLRKVPRPRPSQAPGIVTPDAMPKAQKQIEERRAAARAAQEVKDQRTREHAEATAKLRQKLLKQSQEEVFDAAIDRAIEASEASQIELVSEPELTPPAPPPPAAPEVTPDPIEECSTDALALSPELDLLMNMRAALMKKRGDIMQAAFGGVNAVISIDSDDECSPQPESASLQHSGLEQLSQPILEDPESSCVTSVQEGAGTSPEVLAGVEAGDLVGNELASWMQEVEDHQDSHPEAATMQLEEPSPMTPPEPWPSMNGESNTDTQDPPTEAATMDLEEPSPMTPPEAWPSMNGESNTDTQALTPLEEPSPMTPPEVWPSMNGESNSDKRARSDDEVSNCSEFSVVTAPDKIAGDASPSNGDEFETVAGDASPSNEGAVETVAEDASPSNEGAVETVAGDALSSNQDSVEIIAGDAWPSDEGDGDDSGQPSNDFLADLFLELAATNDPAAAADAEERVASIEGSLQGNDARQVLKGACPFLSQYFIGHPQAAGSGNSGKKGKGKARFFTDTPSEDVMADKVITGCWACGKLDHESRDCVFKRCFICSQQGHESRDCDKGRLWCGQCGRRGHNGDVCPDIAYQKALNICYVKKKVSSVRCLSCGTPGHIQCRQPPLAKQLRTIAPRIGAAHIATGTSLSSGSSGAQLERAAAVDLKKPLQLGLQSRGEPPSKRSRVQEPPAEPASDPASSPPGEEESWWHESSGGGNDQADSGWDDQTANGWVGKKKRGGKKAKRNR